jgi:Transposase
VVRQRGRPSIYQYTNHKVALRFVTRVGHDLQDDSCPTEVNRLGRTLVRWRHQIAAWHTAHVSNSPTEAVNNLINRVKRIAFGITRFRHYRIRACSMPADPTGTYLRPSHPADFDEPMRWRVRVEGRTAPTVLVTDAPVPGKVGQSTAAPAAAGWLGQGGRSGYSTRASSPMARPRMPRSISV